MSDIQFRNRIVIEPKPLQRPQAIENAVQAYLSKLIDREVEIVMEKIILPALCGEMGRIIK